MIDFTPDPIALQLGPFTVFWYGIGYALGLAAAYVVMSREARRRGHDAEVLANGLIVVAIAALIGGRAYHVIDQWQNLYASDPIKVFLPPYTGLGVYGGLITGTIAAFIYARIRRVSFWTWTDLVAPGLFTMQAIARWGNFFNQELYGPPTNLPWGIAIQCDHRIAQYACPAGSPATATLGEHFQPLFLYESLSGLVGLIVLLILARRYRDRFRTGQLLGFFFVWYGVVRFGLETLRADNWTFFGIPTAQIFSSLFILAGLVMIVVRGRRAPTLAAVDAEARAAREPVAPPDPDPVAQAEPAFAAPSADSDPSAPQPDDDPAPRADPEPPSA
ncbi:MAG TPA: prolipoprotein diacylglyceryl transferase [Candidatus Acidoferrum sp.]|nr:prolipoprotein diacylglyceryl transferase [Candidatus Acidoferrum sp.]